MINPEIKEKIVLALDVDTIAQAKELVAELKDYVGVFKVGLQFYTANGSELFEFMDEVGAQYFLDVKFMDIPNTVAKASENVVRKGASFYNLHALGGVEMMRRSMEAARKTAQELGRDVPTVLAVTVLTSISNEALNDELEVACNVNDYALHLAKLAKKAGLTGVVASVFEARRIKEACGEDFKVLCPGIRPEWSAKDDQKRLATPALAIKEGADYLVIGRAVTSAPDRLEAMRKIYAEIEETIGGEFTPCYTRPARLLLGNGMEFVGESFGAQGTATGQIVFNTSMAGYQEVLTDPNNSGQVVVMTYPEIGNCGINAEDTCKNSRAAGLVVKSACEYESHYLSTQTLDKFMKENNIVGIKNVDTRAITRIINDPMDCIITTENITDEMRAQLKVSKRKPAKTVEITPVKTDIKKVMVIGSGPIVIGQAAEFDYAGVQACRAFKEEGVEVVLVNSNPATIMTDEDIADKVYIEPLRIEVLENIIQTERPDGLIASLGGQTGLNLAVELHEAGILQKYDVKLLGTKIDAIKKAEDRELFKNLMDEIGEPVPESIIASSLKEAQDFVKQIGFPVIIRPAYTLGGSGGGIAANNNELEEIVHTGLLRSPISQVLVEKSIAGYKEIEYEVMRDANDAAIVICNMENIDPIGVHTGDSFVVAPTQTLRAKECNMLRNSALKIIRALKIEGGCNVQFALDTKSNRYYVIEVNPRVSRSSALASKATGYPIAKVTAKIALGYRLHEIKNAITQKTTAALEPAIDYVVTKIPKWPFDKFASGDRLLGTKMKATGEVMAIGRTFESSFKKAITSIESKNTGLHRKRYSDFSTEELKAMLAVQDDRRIFRVAEALNRGISVSQINKITKIDPWFIAKIKNLCDFETKLKKEPLTAQLYLEAKEKGFLDTEIAVVARKTLKEIEHLRDTNKISASFKVVDTCAGEFEAYTPYYYSVYNEADEYNTPDGKNILVLGSGPIRIGQGIEFDYCCVHAAWAIKKNGYKSIIVNSNPETLSTDFDVADKLFFEPMNIENIMNIIKRENPSGVMVQFGGQTAINLAPQLEKRGVKILGTSLDAIDKAEDRKLFEALLQELNIPQPKGVAVRTESDARKAAQTLGFPLLVRPSYVIGGRGMQVVYNETELLTYFKSALQFSDEHPVLIDQYIEGMELELDAISDGQDILIPGITEHIERAGVHSGDSMAIYPPQNVKQKVLDSLTVYAQKIAQKLQIKGLFNIQFVVKDDKAYIIEVNPRASRTVPIMSKVTGIPMTDIAVNAVLGKSIREQGYTPGLAAATDLICVKVPVFSFQKLNRIDPALAPEMKSTGEVLGVDYVYEKALVKGFLAAGYHFPEPKGDVMLALNNHTKSDGIEIGRSLEKLGFRIVATTGTHKVLAEHGITSKEIKNFDMEKMQEQMKTGQLAFIINTPSNTSREGSEDRGFKIRTISEIYSTPCFTSTDTATAYLQALEYYLKNPQLEYKSLDKYRQKCVNLCKS